MDSTENQPNPAQMPAASHGVGFAEKQGKGRKILKWVIAVFGVVLIIGIGAFIIIRTSTGDELSPTSTPTPIVQGVTTPETPTPSPTPTSTPEPLSRDEIKIEVLNGTGVSGDAGFLKDRLVKLGYSEVATGNNDDQEVKSTEATFSRDLSETIVSEITDDLKEVYEEVSVKRGTVSEDFSIRIVTGPKSDS